MTARHVVFSLLWGIVATTAQANDPAPASWITPAEASHFRATPSYDDTVAYLKRIERAAPDVVNVETFGTTPQGRPMMVVVASTDGTFTPEAARAAHKPIVLVQAGIHPGEIEGKDAGLMLLRDIAVTGKYPHLLDHVVLVYIPVFSVDGHENTSPYNRINQNGPESMGFRGQSQYLNLNRDYIKADAPEMLAWLKLWQHWLPDFLIDVHTTDGADYQYDLTWYTEDPHKLDPAINDWQKKTIADVAIPAYEQRGHLASIYLEFKDGRDPRQGIENFGSGPRFSTGYAALQNRPALLIETHMLKPYDVRVRAVYDLIEILLDNINRNPDALWTTTRKADADTIARADNPHAQVPLTYKADPAAQPFDLQGYAFTLSHSDISNAMWIQYDRHRPQTYRIDNWNGLLPDTSIAPPAAYVIPAPWTTMIDKLDAHGIRYRRINHVQAIHAQTYQLDHPRWASESFEGHVMLRDFSLSSTQRDVILPAGSVIVPLNQRDANVAIHLLEPQAPDSLVRWGYLNAIFEAKEYGEPRVLEKLARDMMEKDPALKADFEQKLKTDSAFANSSNARLNFFFQRSPWYSVQQVGAYPVLRLDAAQLNELEAETK